MIFLKVIIGKDGISGQAFNDKAQISHEITQKETLSKRNDGVISGKTARKVGDDKPVEGIAPKPRGSPSAAKQRQVYFSKKTPQSKTYKVLNNGVVGKSELTKKKIRVISSKKAAKLKRAKLKKLKKQQRRRMSEQMQLTGIAMYGFSPSKKVDLNKAVGGVKKVSHAVGKPVTRLKQQFYSQADKSDDSGVKAAKLGMQIKDYGTSGLKTAVNTGAKTVKNGSKIAKRVYRKVHKPTSAQLRRKLQKRVNHNLVAEAKFLAKRAAKNGAKAAGKATAKAAQAAAKAAAKAAQAAARAVASAVTKIVGIIAETMPWSMIIIAAILLIVIIALMFGSLISGAGGSVAGGGAWLVDDSNNQTPEEIYEGYKEFIEQAKDVMQTQAKDALKSEVTGFCNGDTTTPRKIIQYIDKTHNNTYYPAKGADTSINALIEQFGTDDYADYMSLLFVLMTREKQQADGVTDEEIYDFDFKKEDFEEFMRTVNENSCRWGDTFVHKTAVETSPHPCPGRNCKTEYRSGCKCSSYTDNEGKIHHYCGGHPYCPVDHTKLTVKLVTIKDYYGKEYPEIYNFSDTEKARYEASKAIIQGLLDYWEG
ncbi:MAG: hypothetical protein HDT13_00475 [Butyrivibrio sp.]|nr:hypothetical protein [Butyrivibrio sp.]